MRTAKNVLDFLISMNTNNDSGKDDNMNKQLIIIGIIALFICPVFIE